MTAAEERLLDLLRCGGAVERSALDDAMRAFEAARASGEDVALGPFLVGRGVVSVTTVQKLLASEDAEPKPKTKSDSRRASRRTSRRSSKRTSRRGAAAEQPAEDEDGPTRRIDPEVLAAASRKREAGGATPASFGAGSWGPGSEGTRRFDPDALAAASKRPPRRKLTPLVALAAGATVVVLLGGLYLARGEAPLGVPSPGPGKLPSGSPDAASIESETNPLTEAERQARTLEAREDYTGALAQLRGLPADVRAAESTLLRALERRLVALGRFHDASDDALQIVEPFRRQRPDSLAERRTLEEGTAKIEGLLGEATPDQLSTPAGARLRRALQELALVASKRTPPNAGTPSGEREPAERQRRFSELAEEGKRVVARAQAAIETARAREESRWEGLCQRALVATQDARLTLTISGGHLEGAVMVDVTEVGFRLRVRKDLFDYTWEEVASSDPALALRLRRLPVRSDNARDHLDLGRWCLRHRQWKAAQQAFGKAITLSEGRFRDRIPDVTAIAKASRVFRGRVDHDPGGTGLTLLYDFRLSAHNVDWTPGGSAQAGVKGGVYTVRGRGFAVSALKEVGWSDWVRATAQLGGVSRGSGALLGLTTHAGGDEELTYLMGVSPQSGEVTLFRRTRGSRPRVIERQPFRVRSSRLALEARGDRLVLQVDGRTLFERALTSPWGRTRLLLGAVAKGPCEASFDLVSVTGTVRRPWLRKAFGEFEDHLRAFLARTDELEVFSRPSGQRPRRLLSAEDDFGLADVSAEATAHVRRGRVKLDLGRPLDLLAAANAFASAAQVSPRYAAAVYLRGLALERLHQPALALREFDQAVALCPRFYEAQAARARVLANAGSLKQAFEASLAALALRPDHPPARSALALVHFRRHDLRRARDQLDLALALDPWDDEVRAFRANVINVLRGPPWEKSHVVETQHYTVSTDISAKRGEEYAAQLEAIRASYEEFFPYSASKERSAATVLIFDTQEGFQSYAALTTDDRVESLLGCYLPRYNQLLLYEDKDDATLEDTRRVLYHEAFHQFMHARTSELPYWLSEGLAEYFSSSKVAQGKVVSRGAALPARLRDLRRYVEEHKRPLSPRALMLQSPSEFYSGQVAVKYAQAWSMVHFLLEGGDADLKQRLRRNLDLLLEGGSPAHSHREAWKGTDWPAFDKAWWAHVRGL
jgi:tetratricopeptide (TPR) repeat protein